MPAVPDCEKLGHKVQSGLSSASYNAQTGWAHTCHNCLTCESSLVTCTLTVFVSSSVVLSGFSILIAVFKIHQRKSDELRSILEPHLCCQLCLCLSLKIVLFSAAGIAVSLGILYWCQGISNLLFTSRWGIQQINRNRSTHTISSFTEQCQGKEFLCDRARRRGKTMTQEREINTNCHVG